MVDCEMCGMKVSKLTTTKIEGTIMKVCPNCARYGSSFQTPNERVNNFTRSRPKRTYTDPDANKVIVKNYSSLIKSAREQKGLKQEQVAKELNEKESLIHSIESGNLRPRFVTARKLEKFFGIKIIEEIHEMSKENNIPEEVDTQPLTMGDILKKAMKGKK